MPCPIVNCHPEIQALASRIALYEDMKAYQRLFGLLAPRLQRFAFSLVKSPEAAEEIVSDVFIKLWQIRGRLTAITNLQVYLYTVTKNFSLDYLTSLQKHRVVQLDEIDVELSFAAGNPEELCISADMVRKINASVRQLPPQCRLIFQLVKEGGLQYKEVAEILQVSLFTVRNQVAIATRKIAEQLPASILDHRVNNRV